ncbi:MAG TPA: hypothetical protein PLP05_08895, partial [Sedimentisphaerales bacterium]|nr:hypothetical protein [Sedimentisphaerales bacterium]
SRKILNLFSILSTLFPYGSTTSTSRRSMFRYYGLNSPSYVDSLEAAARKFYSVKYVLALNSGTGALIK